MFGETPTSVCAASFLLVTAIPANQRNIAPADELSNRPAGDASEPTTVSTADEPKTDVGPPLHHMQPPLLSPPRCLFLLPPRRRLLRSNSLENCLKGMADSFASVDQVQLNLAKQATKPAILMNLESRMVASEDIGRQHLTYGESSTRNAKELSKEDDKPFTSSSPIQEEIHIISSQKGPYTMIVVNRLLKERQKVEAIPATTQDLKNEIDNLKKEISFLKSHNLTLDQRVSALENPKLLPTKALIDSGAGCNCIQEGIIPFRMTLQGSTSSFRGRGEINPLTRGIGLKQVVKTTEETLTVDSDHATFKLLSESDFEPYRETTLRDGRNKNWKKSLIETFQTSLAYGPVYFNAYPNLQISLTDKNYLDALILSIKLHDMIICLVLRSKAVTRRPIKWDEIDFPKEWILKDAAPPQTNLNEEISEVEQSADAFSKMVENDTVLIAARNVNMMLKQHNYANYYMSIFGEQISALHEKIDKISTMVHKMLMHSTICNSNAKTNDRGIAKMIKAEFTGQLKGWWNSYLTADQKIKIIQSTVKTEDGQDVINAVYTLIINIIEHFYGRWTDNSKSIQTLLQNLRCGLPMLFAERIRKTLRGPNVSIGYEAYTYGNLIKVVTQEDLALCNEIKLNQQVNKYRLTKRQQLGKFCEQFTIDILKSSRESHKHKKRKYSEERKSKKIEKKGKRKEDYKSKKAYRKAKKTNACY
ncbi:hypothetical protein FXO37_07942 [Capsicum annuum]|nr:hypothetical protein FXO37_07942 [Capsicum annuum]